MIVMDSFKGKQTFQKKNIDSNITIAKNKLYNISVKDMSKVKQYIFVSAKNQSYKLDSKNKKCSLCDKTLSSPFSLRRHLQSVHKLKQITNSLLFLPSTSSPMEEWTTNVDNSCVCIFCDKNLCDKSNLKRHLRSMHKLSLDDVDDLPPILSPCPKNKTTLTMQKSVAMPDQAHSINTHKVPESQAQDQTITLTKKNVQAFTKKRVLFDLPSIKKIMTHPKEVTTNTYYDSSNMNRVHNILKTYNNKLQLPVNDTTVTEKSNKMQTFQNHSNATQINKNTISILGQSNDVQTAQIGNNETLTSVNNWPNKMHEIQAPSDQTITLYSEQLLDSNSFETSDIIDQNKVVFQSTVQNQINLSSIKMQISTGRTNVSTQTEQIYYDIKNGSQEILDCSNQLMNQHKAHILDNNDIKLCPVDESNKINSYGKRIIPFCNVYNKQFKHKPEIHNSQQQILGEKIKQLPHADVNINQLNACTITNVSYHPNKTQVIEMKNNCVVAQHKAQTLDTNTFKTQKSENNSFVAPNDNKKLDSKLKIIPYNVSGNKSITVKKYPDKKIRSSQEKCDICYICFKTYANKYSLKTHMGSVHKVLNAVSKPVTTSHSYKQNTKHNSDTSKITDNGTNFQTMISNNAEQVQHIESVKPNKIFSSCANSSQSNNDAIISTFSNRAYGSVMGNSTEMKVVKAVNDRKNTVMTHIPLKSGQQNANDLISQDLYSLKKQNQERFAQRVTCLICKNTFSEKYIKRHIRNMHKINKDAVVYIAGKGYGSRDQLNTAQVTEVFNIKKHDCITTQRNKASDDSIVCISDAKSKSIDLRKAVVHSNSVNNGQMLNSKNVDIESYILKKPLQVYSKNVEVEARIVNKERTGETISNNHHQIKTNKCLKKISPTIVQFNQKYTKETNTACNTDRFKEINDLESVCYKTRVAADDGTYTNCSNQSNSQTLQSCYNKMCVTSKPCTLLDTQTNPQEAISSNSIDNVEFQLKNNNETKCINASKKHKRKKCKKNSLNYVEYQLHLIAHSPLKCTECIKPFKSHWALNWHEQTQGEVGLHMCANYGCSNLSFSTRKEYLEHKKSHVQ